ncbi:hypothetical protein EQV77_05805 [Halobacillus fulvus]|nr:hypothetical protein EQV77_05805 [Halobacillus fulvus]
MEVKTVKELCSYQVHFSKPLKTNQIMKLYKLAGKTQHHMYIHQGKLIADTGHLPKLLSFSLLMDMDTPVVFIIDGEDVEKVFEEIKGSLSDYIDHTICRRKYNDAMMVNETSVTI